MLLIDQIVPELHRNLFAMERESSEHGELPLKAAKHDCPGSSNRRPPLSRYAAGHCRTQQARGPISAGGDEQEGRHRAGCARDARQSEEGLAAHLQVSRIPARRRPLQPRAPRCASASAPPHRPRLVCQIPDVVALVIARPRSAGRRGPGKSQATGAAGDEVHEPTACLASG